MLDNIKVENINKKPFPVVMVIAIVVLLAIMIILVGLMLQAPTSPL